MVRVSVVIPAYNAIKYLPETIDNLLEQTFTDYEVVIVDDGSSDETVSWVSQLNLPNLKLITQENQGPSVARNTGIANSQGEYIALLDADDLWDRKKLEKQVAILDKYPEVGLVYTWVALIDNQGIPTGRVFNPSAEGHVWKHLIKENLVGCGSVAIIRRCCFEECGVFDRHIKFGEDWDMWLRIAERYSFKVIREHLVYYRQHSSSNSRNWEGMERGFQVTIEKAFESAPPELRSLKNESYAIANLCLAWKPLQSVYKDHEKARYFQKKAIASYPPIRFSKENLKLTLAIQFMSIFGADGYQKFLEWGYRIRRNIVFNKNISH